MPKLSELLNQERLGLKLIGAQEKVSFASVQIITEATLWLEPQSLWLVPTGFKILPKLKTGRPAALVYPQADEEILSVCRDFGIAFMTLPRVLSVERLRDEALKLILAEADLRGGFALDSYLSEALESNKPERELLERLQKLTGANFALYSSWYALLAQAGIINLTEQALELAEGKHETGRQALWVFLIQTKDKLEAKLMVTGLKDDDAGLVLSACRLLRLALAQRNLQIQTVALQKETLFNEWLLGKAQDLKLRLASYGFDYGIKFVVLIARPGGRLRKPQLKAQLQEMKEKGDVYFTTTAFPFISSQRESHCVWVISSSNTAMLASFYWVLESEQSTVQLGSSLPNASYTDLNNSYQQALLAADSLGSESGYANFSQFDPIFWTFQQQPRANLETLRDGLIGKLKQEDKSGKLQRTLAAYLKNPEDLGGLAKSLHVHVNTLRYRLSKIEELIGKPLAKPETLAQLYMALQMDKMLED
ncbi:MAG: helix-turn-helix domain-containing protein [Trueperaceae bacterium]|nr:helix-turn-helix domain-containing protein [Trueperaceae bacterium]